MDKEMALIEAILFMENEPIELGKLVRISQFTKDLTLEVLDKLQEKYASENSGLELSEVGGGYSLIPKKALWEILKDHYGKRNDEKLSKSALETMAIIAYSQPLTRAEIDSIRGVNSSGILKILLEKGFIKEVGRKEGPGKPVQYGTTKEFLKQFGLNSISDLPKLDEVQREKFELNGE